MKKHPKMLLSLAASGLSAGLLCGAETEAKQPEAAARKEIAAEKAEPFFRGIDLLMPMTVTALYQLPADVKKADARMSRWQVSAEVAARHATETGLFYGSLAYSYTNYHFSGASTNFFGDTERVLAYARYEQALNRTWGFFVDASGGFAAEKAANMSDGTFGRLGGGVRYTVSEDLSVFVGAQVLTRMSDSATVLPHIGFSWKIDDRWSLNAVNGLVLSYNVYLDRSLRLDLGCTYSNTNFRLRDDSSGRHQALEIQEVPLALSATQELGKASYVRGSVAGLLYSKYKGRSGGNSVGEMKTDPSVVFGLEAGVRF